MSETEISTSVDGRHTNLKVGYQAKSSLNASD